MTYYILGILTIVYIAGVLFTGFLGALGRAGFWIPIAAITWPIWWPALWLAGKWDQWRWRDG